MGKWFGAIVLNVVVYSLIYIGVMILIHCYFYYISRQQAEEINNLLKGMRNNGGILINFRIVFYYSFYALLICIIASEVFIFLFTYQKGKGKAKTLLR